MIFGKHLNRYYLRYSPHLLLGIAALILVDLLQLKIPELYNHVVNGMNSGSVVYGGETVAFDMDFLLDHICRPMLFIIFAIVIGRFLWRFGFHTAALGVETDLRDRMFDRCKDLSRQYYQLNKVGNLMSLFTNDIETVQDCFGMGVLMLCDVLLLGGMSFVKMWRMNRGLTLLSLIPMLLLLAVSTVVSKSMTKKWKKRQEAFSALSDFSQESFSGLSVIKAFVKETKELMAFRKINRQNENANVAYTRLSTLVNIGVTLFVESVICVILGYGGYLVHTGSFNVGQLVEFIGYFSSIVWPVMAVSQLIEMTSRGKASLARISELLDADIDVKDREGAKDLPQPVRGELELRNLSFRYPDEEGRRDALKQVSFRIPAGTHVGIVGKTGSGKTTVVDLLLRTYNVPDGCIFFDGNDVNDLTIRSVRAACAYVPQDNFLFSDTIARNIGFSMDEPDEAQVEAAARLSVVHENIVEFRDRYNTVLGERGVTVSGGQKQRISIARALMKDAPVLILDDSVSAVDTATEKTILENLKKTRRGKTTLLIAHRISTVQNMDAILFLQDGAVLDYGSHEQLLSRCDAYRRMVELQKLEEESTAEAAGEVTPYV